MKRRVRMKPGKGQSAAGMAVGILFCLLGIFVVIPSFGVFGIFWPGMALIITIMNGINAFSDKGITSHEIYIDDGQEPDADRNTWRDDGEDADTWQNSQDPEVRLRRLKRLREEGLITDEEYEARRKEIIRQI